MDTVHTAGIDPRGGFNGAAGLKNVYALSLKLHLQASWNRLSISASKAVDFRTFSFSLLLGAWQAIEGSLECYDAAFLPPMKESTMSSMCSMSGSSKAFLVEILFSFTSCTHLE